MSLDSGKTQVLRRGHPAMGTWFEAILSGVDAEHLDAVALAVFEEIDRVERLLSRFDPKSELARVNREASSSNVIIGYELLGVLLDCRRAWEITEGAFDVTAKPVGKPTSFEAVTIDADRRTVRVSGPDVTLDLGGIGKGYALDRGAEIVRNQGVRKALLHGGASSVLAIGTDVKGKGWDVGIRDPFCRHDEATERFRVALADRGLACSAVFGDNSRVSDLIDPRSGEPLDEEAATVVIAESATWAEVWSTALLTKGRAGAFANADRLAGSSTRAAWIDRRPEGPVWEWIAS